MEAQHPHGDMFEHRSAMNTEKTEFNQPTNQLIALLQKGKNGDFRAEAVLSLLLSLSA